MALSSQKFEGENHFEQHVESFKADFSLAVVKKNPPIIDFQGYFIALSCYLQTLATSYLINFNTSIFRHIGVRRLLCLKDVVYSQLFLFSKATTKQVKENGFFRVAYIFGAHSWSRLPTSLFSKNVPPGQKKSSFSPT